MACYNWQRLVQLSFVATKLGDKLQEILPSVTGCAFTKKGSKKEYTGEEKDNNSI